MAAWNSSWRTAPPNRPRWPPGRTWVRRLPAWPGGRKADRWVTSGQADASGRLLNASESMVPLVQRSFQGIEARRAVGAQAAVGELREVRAAGYPHFFGMAGLHTFFHTTADTSAMTRPELLEPVIRAFADAIDGVGR